MSLEPSVNIAHSIIPLPPVLFPPSSSSITTTSPPIQPIEESNIPPCNDYPLDVLANELDKFLDCNGWLLQNIKLQALPKAADCVAQINKLLEKPKVVHVKLPGKTISVSLTLKEIFDVLRTKNQLRGGYLRYLLSSKWYLEAIASLIEKPSLKALLSPELLSHIDRLPKDIDFRHFVSNGVTSEAAAESVVQLIAGKIPKQEHNYTHAGLCNYIRQKGSTFEDFDVLFTIEDGDVKTDALLLGLDGGEEPDVDLLIAAKLENKDAALTTIQDLWLDLDEPISPNGFHSKGWQSVIDTSCKVLHLNRKTPQAFTSAISAMVKQFRCPESIHPKVFESLREHCLKSKFHASRTIAKMMKMELKKHHDEPAKAGISYTYMAVSQLLRNGSNLEIGQKLWEGMSQKLHDHDTIMIGDSNTQSILSSIHHAALNLPFELVDAAIQVQQFIALNRPRDKNDLKNGLFLRVNEKKYTIMSIFDGSAIITPCNPSTALETLMWYLTKSYQLQDGNQLKILIDLLTKLSKDRGYVFEESSPIKEKSIIRPTDIQSFLKSAHTLLTSQHAELNKLGYQLAVDCYALTSNKEAFELMLTFLPDIIAKETDASRLKNLYLYLDRELAKPGNIYFGRGIQTIQGQSQGCFFGLQDQLGQDKDPHDICIKRMVDSGNDKLSILAYKMLLKKSRGMPLNKKAKIIIRFAYLLKDKQPELALKVAEKHLEDCSFETDELLKLLKGYIAVRSKSTISDKHAKKIATTLKHFVDKYPSLHKDLQQAFLDKCKGLLDTDFNSGYNLMSQIAQESSLFHLSDQLSEIWIQYCELLFYKPDTDIMSVLKMWKIAENLNLWNSSKKSFQDHRQFLVKFTEKLYSLNFLEADSSAHLLVDILDKHIYKDEYSVRTQQLGVIRTNRKLGEHRTQEELALSVKTLITLLTTGYDESQSVTYQESAKRLIETLSQPHPDINAHSANLARAKNLLENPHLQKLFLKKSSELQAMVIKCLDSFYNIRKFNREDPKIYSLLETLFSLAFSDSDHAQHVQAVTILQRFIALPDFDFKGSHVTILARFFLPILTTMELNGSYAEILALIRRVLSENRIIENNLPKISNILRGAIKCELKRFTGGVKVSETLSDTSSNSEEESLPGSKHKTMLKTDERYANIFRCIPLLNEVNNPEITSAVKSLEFCTFMVESLIILEAFPESFCWVDRLIELEKINGDSQNDSVRLVLLTAAIELASAENFEKSMSIFEFLYQRYTELNTEILSSMVQNSDEFAKLRPRTYAKILQHTLPKEKNPLFNKRYTTAVNNVLGRLVRPSSRVEDLSIAMKFYEIWPDALQFPFQPILEQIAASKDLDLKRRAHQLLPVRVYDRLDLALYSGNTPTIKAWKSNWKLSLKLLQDLWRKTHEEDFKVEILEIVKNLVDSDSNLVSFLKQISKNKTTEMKTVNDKLRIKSLEGLLPICGELIDDFKKYDVLLHDLMVLKEATSITGYNSLREALDVLFVKIFGTIRTPEEFYYACMCLNDFFKLNDGKLSGKPVNLFISLLNKIPTNLKGDNYYHIYYKMNELLLYYKGSVLTPEEILRIAESVAPYQNDIPQATNWITFAKGIPEIKKSFKTRIEAIKVREKSNHTIFIARFIVAFGGCYYIYNRLKNDDARSYDYAFMLLLLLLLRFGPTSTKKV